ncbi:MAG: hypothetical protein CMI36_13585 [Owenweeksia sp.]|nr:hypothetical protein [Owenweeksia sp.]MBG00021.1 hypothetical protein [Owenweeksia sp.]HBF22033.1 hypothetical protein [Cryomorphaceae bacterium]HCQ14903.1 hypothetical protein [Cryomorphaceae bacterium]|tara:strand:+ start:12664 stop:13554 length:891 start_codon:yes stop_codon:yes gene_type:complete
MKKLLLLFILFSSFQLIAQSNADVMNSRWINGYYEVQNNGGFWFPELVSTTKYCTSSDDTLINGLSYVKLYSCGAPSANYRGALRVDQDRWYFHSRDSATEMLLYDFGLNLGDTLKEAFYTETALPPSWGPMIVTQVDTLPVLGVARKHIWFNNSSGAWIEGIGCEQGLLWDPYPNISNFAIALECFSHGDTTRLASSNYNGNLNQACQLTFSLREEASFPARMYPNPCKDHLTLEIGQYAGPLELRIYSARGEELFSRTLRQTKTTLYPDLPEGIYTVIGTHKNRSFIRRLVVAE